MPVTIITTPSGETSNSYATLAEAISFLSELLYTDAFLAEDEETQKRALVLMCQRLSEERYKGVRTVRAQRLPWPRFGVSDIDGYSDGDYGLYNDELASTTVPRAIKEAQMLGAAQLIETNFLAENFSTADYEKVELPGGLKVTYKDGASGGASTAAPGALPADVRRLIAPYLLEATGELLRA